MMWILRLYSRLFSLFGRSSSIPVVSPEMDQAIQDEIKQGTPKITREE